MALNEHRRIVLNSTIIADFSLPGNSMGLNLCSIFDFVLWQRLCSLIDKHWEIPNISVLNNISAFSLQCHTASLNLVTNCVVKHLSAVCSCGFLLF